MEGRFFCPKFYGSKMLKYLGTEKSSWIRLRKALCVAVFAAAARLSVSSCTYFNQRRIARPTISGS